MPSAKRLVVDASALISGVASRPGGGPPWLLLDALIDCDFEAIVCPRLIDELRKGLTSTYFQQRFDPDDLAEIVTGIEGAATSHENPKKIPPVLRDSNDDYLVALARAVDAMAIVTGDRDLLDHPGLAPPAIDCRTACKCLGLLD